MTMISLSADIVAFSLELGILLGGKSRSVGAMLSLYDDQECPLELDVDAMVALSATGPAHAAAEAAPARRSA